MKRSLVLWANAALWSLVFVLALQPFAPRTPRGPAALLYGVWLGSLPVQLALAFWLGPRTARDPRFAARSVPLVPYLTRVAALVGVGLALSALAFLVALRPEG